MKRIILLAMLGIGCCFPIKAQTNVPAATNFTVFLSGASEVPPNQARVTASAWFTLDGNNLGGLLGISFFDSILTGVGIYGPAQAGQNGNFIFEYDLSNYTIDVGNGAPGGIYYSAGIGGLTPAQVTQLQAGLWYLNINTTNFPNGELRGQICPQTPNSDCDGDGVPDKQDVCLNTPPGAVVDASGCSIEQLVPCDGPWKNHHEYVKAVKEAAKRFSKERLIPKEEEKLIVKDAEKSNCGNSTHPPIYPFPGPLPGTALSFPANGRVY